MQTKVLKSELAGSWYTDHPGQLAREVDSYLEAAAPQPVEDVIALLLPHAGYRYSGMVAAHGVKLLRQRRYSRVIVIGPSHRLPMLDSVSLPDATHIETPLGRIEIDRPAVERLWQDPAFQSHPRAHASEHSVQIELPFLQRVLGDFKLVPVICGELDEPSARSIAATLLGIVDSETLVVVSSDFTHYGRGFDYLPFHTDIPANLRKLDLGAFKTIEERDLSAFLFYVQKTGATICGRSPIAVLLAMLPVDASVRLLKYDTSGNLTGDWSHCVSYLSAAVSGQWGTLPAHTEPVLTKADQKELLRFARQCIAARLTPGVVVQEVQGSPATRRPMGAFVTLHKYGHLRGCIGEIFPRRALVEAVAEQAVNAAFHDPRFPRLREDELSGIDIEISALTPPRRVGSFREIETGRHGVVLHKGGRSAVFLPQVAPQQGWGLEETLTHLAQKAGLGPDDWRSGCSFEVFEAVVFGEKHR